MKLFTSITIHQVGQAGALAGDADAPGDHFYSIIGCTFVDTQNGGDAIFRSVKPGCNHHILMSNNTHFRSRDRTAGGAIDVENRRGNVFLTVMHSTFDSCSANSGGAIRHYSFFDLPVTMVQTLVNCQVRVDVSHVFD